MRIHSETDSGRASLPGGPGEACPDSSPAAILLVCAFGTSVAMWWLGYLARLPGVTLPSPMLFFVLAGALIAGGGVAGRHSPRSLSTGALTGLLASVVNLLVFGSILAEGEEGVARPAVLAMIAGFLSCGALLGGIGGWVGGRLGARSRAAFDGPALFPRVTAAATLLLIFIGGVVTSEEAGLAVPDWPTTWGLNMFLFPLSRMSGGVYYEHAHRLFGALVGLTTLVQAAYLTRAERRRWVRRLALLALVLVIGQGLLGWRRIAEAVAGVDRALSTAFAVIHGLTAQIFFALVVALAAATSRAWRSLERAATEGAATDRFLGGLLLAAALMQIFLGGLVRHVGEHWVMPHIAGAVLILMVGIGCGVRNAGLHRRAAPLRRTGQALLLLILSQFVLGFATLAMTGGGARDPSSGATETLLSTTHQTTGALIVACAALQLLWTRRLLALPSEHSPLAVATAGAGGVDESQLSQEQQ